MIATFLSTKMVQSRFTLCDLPTILNNHKISMLSNNVTYFTLLTYINLISGNGANNSIFNLFFTHWGKS